MSIVELLLSAHRLCFYKEGVQLPPYIYIYIFMRPPAKSLSNAPQLLHASPQPMKNHKQLLSINDLPPSIPAFNIVDLAHAVDTFRPCLFNDYELPHELPVYDKSTGTFKRFINRNRLLRRVASAPPMVTRNDKELPVAPDAKRNAVPLVMNKGPARPLRNPRPRIVLGPPVPPKEPQYGIISWHKPPAVPLRQSCSKRRFLLQQLSELSASYQVEPLKLRSIQSSMHKMPPVSPLSPKDTPLVYPVDNEVDDFLSDEAWCYRDMY